MEILKFPHPALLTPCKSVTVFGSELKTILDSMYKTMIEAKGIGLAANQVGLDLRMFTMILEGGTRLDVINPEICDSSKTINQFKEGCLSAPGEFVITGDRPSWVAVKYQDEFGLTHGNIFFGINAVAFFHELDHLDGKAFIQSKNIPKKKRREICRRWGLKP